MLRRYATYISLFRSVSDLCFIGCIWLLVFYIRFFSRAFATSKGIPDFKRHLVLTLPVVAICYLACYFTGLYKPKRIQNVFVHLADIFKASIFSGLFLIAFFYYFQDVPYSRKLIALFGVLLFAGLFYSHLLTMVILRKLRAKGYNLRYYAVIGANQKGQQLVSDIEQMGWLGLRCIFFVDNNAGCAGTELMGIPVYGPVEKLPELLKIATIDEVYLALDGSEAQQAYPVLEKLQAVGVTIRIIPDWGNLTSISGNSAMTIGSQVLFSAAESPLSGANVLLKGMFDRAAAIVLLAVFAIPMLLMAVMVKLTSRGSVFYRQVRMGMDQKEFMIIKFRTMRAGAENEETPDGGRINPQWTKHNDPRCTFFGSALRRTSLDELPQLINVVKGQMSLVGPRPERPVLAKHFSEEYKRYMLRHKVKAGVTGWAQINGFRGDTSLRKRLVYDLYYVRNWSFVFDLWILLVTPWHIIGGENAY
jgi:Undecaprenyl-phosphate glucose phosphotransferase